jgi:hypothetical protein
VRWPSTKSKRCERSASSASLSPGTTAWHGSPTDWRATILERIERMALFDIVPTL